jgi:hypothetical protein
MRLRITLGLAGVIATAAGGTAEGQLESGTSTFVGYRTWTASSAGGDATVSQWLVPVSGHIQLRPSWDLTIWDAGASSVVEGGGLRARLDGTTSTSVLARLRLAGDRVLLQTGVTIPSGKRGLDAEEANALRVIGLPLLRFGLRHYGRGPEANLGATLAFPWSQSTAFSVGAGYTARGEYTLFDNAEDYRPASEWAINGGLDWGNSDMESQGMFVRTNATLRLFGTDQLGGRDAYEEGDQLEFALSARTGGSGVLWNTAIRAAFQAKNTIHGSSVLSQLDVASGNGVFVSGGGSLPLRPHWRAGLDLEWNQVSGSEEFGRDGFSFALGPTLDWDRDRFGVRLCGTYLGGRLDATGGGNDVDLRGFATDASLRWVYGR